MSGPLHTEQTHDMPEGASEELVGIYALLLAGQTNKEQTAGLLGQALYGAKFLAAISAVTTAWTWAVSHGKPDALPHVPLGLESGPQRLTAAATTILDDEMPAEQDEFRLDRLARAEVLETLADMSLEALEDYGIEEWRWVTDEDPCDSCAERGGEVYPISEKFRDHPGCRCTFEPVIPDDWSNNDD